MGVFTETRVSIQNNLQDYKTTTTRKIEKPAIIVRMIIDLHTGCCGVLRIGGDSSETA